MQSARDFELQFTDTDNVSSRRHVLIEAVKDSVPAVNVTIDGIRKTNAGYMVTPTAMIPFAGTIADSYGIESADYVLSLVRLETSAVLGAQAFWAAGSTLHFAPGDPVSVLIGTVAVRETPSSITTVGLPAEQTCMPLGIVELALPDRLGSPNNRGGALVTRSGLVFIGGGDGYFYAFDSATGREISRIRIPHTNTANPMTYRTRSGRQFIVMAVGGQPAGQLVAFALPLPAAPAGGRGGRGRGGAAPGN